MSGNEKILYAIVPSKLEFTTGGLAWVPRPDLVVYTHAEDAPQARARFLRSLKGKARTHTRVFECAPSVGFFCDDNGEGRSLDG